MNIVLESEVNDLKMDGGQSSFEIYTMVVYRLDSLHMRVLKLLNKDWQTCV